tara:strand:- start:160 stop:324 length:165 start_codon:yes stop_codon:yes gene_type:complete
MHCLDFAEIVGGVRFAVGLLHSLAMDAQLPHRRGYLLAPRNQMLQIGQLLKLRE